MPRMTIRLRKGQANLWGISSRNPFPSFTTGLAKVWWRVRALSSPTPSRGWSRIKTMPSGWLTWLSRRRIWTHVVSMPLKTWGLRAFMICRWYVLVIFSLIILVYSPLPPSFFFILGVGVDEGPSGQMCGQRGGNPLVPQVSGDREQRIRAVYRGRSHP